MRAQGKVQHWHGCRCFPLSSDWAWDDSAMHCNYFFRLPTLCLGGCMLVISRSGRCPFVVLQPVERGGLGPRKSKQWPYFPRFPRNFWQLMHFVFFSSTHTRALPEFELLVAKPLSEYLFQPPAPSAPSIEATPSEPVAADDGDESKVTTAIAAEAVGCDEASVDQQSSQAPTIPEPGTAFLPNKRCLMKWT